MRGTRHRADALQAHRTRDDAALAVGVSELQATESPSEPSQALPEGAVRVGVPQSSTDEPWATSGFGIPPSFR